MLKSSLHIHGSASTDSANHGWCFTVYTCWKNPGINRHFSNLCCSRVSFTLLFVFECHHSNSLAENHIILFITISWCPAQSQTQMQNWYYELIFVYQGSREKWVGDYKFCKGHVMEKVSVLRAADSGLVCLVAQVSSGSYDGPPSSHPLGHVLLSAYHTG